MQLNIRVADENDIPSLVEFNLNMAFETEQKRLNTKVLTSGVSALVKDANKGYYLVAETADQVVGSLMVTTEWSDWRNAVFWWIQSVYIVPEHRRKGIYAQLYTKVKELAKTQGNICGFRLYVEKENVVAQQTYQALGMHESHYLMYEEE
ncbi:MAG: GNAT family N-acetyltransferase [Paraglaciecola sp.]|uniref:GNAT family N-acetyltransferase n=1 Tax=Paraglaciecola sp. TaxID=1920173 RepID=UPI00273D9430|nr:GNAT family N-acetyltransferase [Paraglaciecola sp.]MDP5030253.1 GNAT family N-acetyltransferase [Paraglaciecola sp.]MDP5133852.1 GNAT family N-acetyltransferase [Paraglaciecola sp.]